MDEQINNHANDNPDPHESKISPDDPRLKIPRMNGKVLKKGPVLVVLFSIALLITLAFLFAFQHKDKKDVKKSDAKMETPKKAQAVTIPEFITKAPDNKSPVPVAVSVPVPSNVPDLMEPLPEDTEKTTPRAVSKSGPVDYTNSVHQASHPQLKSKPSQDLDADKVYDSGVFFSSETSSHSNGTDQGVDKLSQNVLDLYKTQLDQSRGLYATTQNANNGIGQGTGAVSSDQNQQAHKNAFTGDLKGNTSKSNYVDSEMKEPRSPYQIMAGTIIPASLITGIDSDLPGMIVGQVRENVYDTVTGNYLLIPQGSRLIATYDSVVSYAQNRVLVVWSRLIRPDGSSINFDSAPGADLEGYAGLSDKVDYHMLRILSGVVLSSALSATVTRSQGATTNSENLSYNQAFAANAGNEINSVGQEITRKNINIQPTIKIRPGFSVNILVNKDMIIPPYKS